MFKVVILGAGGMAREHARAFADLPGVSVVGLWNRTRARAEALAAECGIPLVCDSISELHDRTAADLAVMAVSETAANPIARACFAHPWGVFMEKPPGLNVPDCRAIEEAAAAQGRRVWVALNRRFLSSTRTAADQLAMASGARFIHVQDQQDLTSLGQYNYPSVILENWMYANSIHLVDYFAIFARGSLTRLTVLQPWTPTRPGVVAAYLEFDSGDTGLYTALWDGPGPWMVTVSTSTKRWELRPLEQAQFQNRGERKLQVVEISEADRRFKPGFRLQAEHVVRAVQGETSDSPTLADAMASMHTVRRIYGHE